MKRFVIALLIGIAAFPAGTALADSPQVARIEVSAPSQARVGDELQIEARALDASGAPIAGIELAFTEAVTFLNTGDSALLGKAKTNANGKAAIAFMPRSEGANNITVAPTAQGSKAKASATIDVATGPTLHQSERGGLEVPGVNMWLMAFLLGSFWAMFLWAMFHLRTIFLQGKNQTSNTRLGQRHA